MSCARTLQHPGWKQVECLDLACAPLSWESTSKFDFWVQLSEHAQSWLFPVAPAWSCTGLPGLSAWTLVQQQSPYGLPRCSSARAMPWFTSCWSGSSFNVVPLALLYREARHFTWYVASCAIRSHPLSLASSRLSSSFRAHFLTLASSSKVEASCRVPLPACPHKRNTCQLKFVVCLHSDGCTSLGHLLCDHRRFSPSRLETALFCCIRVYTNHATWLCGARMLFECPHHHPVWRDL